MQRLCNKALKADSSLYTTGEKKSHVSSKAVQVRGSLYSCPLVAVFSNKDSVIFFRYLCLVVDDATSDANAVQKLITMINQL